MDALGENDVFANFITELGVTLDSTPFDMSPVSVEGTTHRISEEETDEFWKAIKLQSSCAKTPRNSIPIQEDSLLEEVSKEEKTTLIQQVLENIKAVEPPTQNFKSSFVSLFPVSKSTRTIGWLVLENEKICRLTPANMSLISLNAQTEEYHHLNHKMRKACDELHIPELESNIFKKDLASIIVVIDEKKNYSQRNPENINALHKLLTELITYIHLDRSLKEILVKDVISFRYDQLFIEHKADKIVPYVKRDLRLNAPTIKGWRNLIYLRNFCFYSEEFRLPYQVDLLSSTDEHTSNQILLNAWQVFYQCLAWFGLSLSQIIDLIYHYDKEGKYQTVICPCGKRIVETTTYFSLNHECRVKEFLIGYMPEVLEGNLLYKGNFKKLSDNTSHILSQLIESRCTKWFWAKLGRDKYRLSLAPTGQFKMVYKTQDCSVLLGNQPHFQDPRDPTKVGRPPSSVHRLERNGFPFVQN